MDAQDNSSQLEVAVIGAGFSGICMGIKLREAGITNFKIFEKTGGISGTWYDNTYPGAACDVPSHLYCFSFELNPDWSRVYSPQPEIKAYVERCAEKYGILPHIHFKTEIVLACFDEDAALWHIRTAEGEDIAARILVSGAGALNHPMIPKISGIDDFTGAMFHSARWNHDHDITGKRVAVIGSAASGIQIIPEIAPQVEQLYVFQRTPNYIVPRLDRNYSEKEKWLNHRFSILVRLRRWLIYWLMESRFIAFRKNSWLGARLGKLAIAYIRRKVSDRQLCKKLIPQYPLGCKRILLSDDYYATLNRENVEVVTNGIDHIGPNAIVTKDTSRYEVDTIILATGFRVTDLLSPIETKGLSGLDLNEAWQNGAEAYYGVTVSGFPNFFILLGPNTGLGHNSVIFMIEAQVNYVMKCIKKLGEGKYIDVKESAMRRYNDRIQGALENTVWAANCASWYKMENGKITALWPYNTVRYWRSMSRPNFNEYEIVT